MTFFNLFQDLLPTSFLARQGERVRDREVFFLSLTQGGRWRTFKDWWEFSHFVRFCQICSQVRDEHLGLKPDQLVWLGVSYQQVPKFFSFWGFLSPSFWAAGVSLPVQPDGRRLDAQPLTKCDASRGRRLCQSWVSTWSLFIIGMRLFVSGCHKNSMGWGGWC